MLDKEELEIVARHKFRDTDIQKGKISHVKNELAVIRSEQENLKKENFSYRELLEKIVAEYNRKAKWDKMMIKVETWKLTNELMMVKHDL